MRTSTRKNGRKFFAVFASFLISYSSFGAGFQFGGIRNDITSFPAATSTRILTSASTQVLRVTGAATTGQVALLPDATTLQAGYWYNFQNESAGPLTVSNSASTALCIASSGTTSSESVANLYLTSSSTAGGPWTCSLQTPAAVGCVDLVATNNVVDWSSRNCFAKTLGANATLTFINPAPGQVVNFRFTNTASNYVLNWPTSTLATTFAPSYSIKWPTATAPTLTTGAHSDVFSCWLDNSFPAVFCNPVQNY